MQLCRTKFRKSCILLAKNWIKCVPWKTQFKSRGKSGYITCITHSDLFPWDPFFLDVASVVDKSHEFSPQNPVHLLPQSDSRESVLQVMSAEKLWHLLQKESGTVVPGWSQGARRHRSSRPKNAAGCLEMARCHRWFSSIFCCCCLSEKTMCWNSDNQDLTMFLWMLAGLGSESCCATICSKQGLHCPVDV